MERKLKRVQRWLDRCVQACRGGRWSAALAEVECARAELETARGYLWEKVQSEGSTRSVESYLITPVRSLAIAVMVVMIAAIPISTGGYRPVATDAGRDLQLEWVTPDEQSVLRSLRTNLSEMNMARIPEAGTGTEVTVSPATSNIRQEKRVFSSETIEPSTEPEITLSLDEVLTLLEAGQRALRGEEYNIRSSSAER